MGTFTIYPAIDLRFGSVVRLRQGKSDQQTVYSENPEAVAENWIKEGAEWLHVVNLNGAFGEGTQKNEAAIKNNRIDTDPVRNHCWSDIQAIYAHPACGCILCTVQGPDRADKKRRCLEKDKKLILGNL